MLTGKRYTPEDILAIAWGGRWLILVPFVLIAGATAIWSRTLPNLFRSDTLIVVVPPRVPESYVRTTVSEKIDARLPALTQQILSRTRLERIIQDFGLYAEERRTSLMEEIVRKMREQDVKVGMVKGDAFQVSYVSTDARTAMKVAEKLGSLFIEENLRDREVLAEGANQFLQSQLDDARRRLLEHEKALADYRRKYAPELPSQLQSNLQVIQNAQSQLQILEESINRDRERRLLFERQLADAGAGEIPPPAAAAAGTASVAAPVTAAARLDEARRTLQVLERRLKPEHPDMLAGKRAIRDLEEAAAKEAALRSSDPDVPVTAGPAEVSRANRLRELRAQMDDVDRQVASKEATKQRLHASIGEYQRRVDVAPMRESEMIALSRDYETLNKIYTDLLGKREGAQVAANLERRQIGEQFKVIDPARLPEQPFSPNRLRLNLMGVAGGLALGLGLVVLLELRDSSVKSEAEVISLLALPVLAVVPMMLTRTELRRRRRLRFVIAGTCATGVTLLGATVVAWKLGVVPLGAWKDQVLQVLR